MDADLVGYTNRRPATLSGGQHARIALMRVLLSEPKTLLLDEPFSALDTSLREHLRAFVFDHARQLGLPALLVMHDRDDATVANEKIIDLSELRETTSQN